METADNRDNGRLEADTFNLFDLDQLLFLVNAMKRAKKIDVYTFAGNLHFVENFQF